MDPRTLDFIIFLVYSVLCVVLGHTARQRGWVREETSRPIHLLTLVVAWSLAGFLSLWKLPIQPQTLWLAAIEPLVVVVPAFGVLALARAVGMARAKAGVLALAAGISNSGFTLGAYLCYTLLPSPAMTAARGMNGAQIHRASESALAYAVAVVMLLSTCIIVFLFPMARYCGAYHTEDQSLVTLIRRSLIDVKAMNLYAAIAGVSLAIAAKAYPAAGFPPVLDRWHVLTVLIYLGAAGAYFGIGLRLHLSHLRLSIKPHLLLAGVKFAAIPLLTAALLGLARLTPRPPTPLARDVFLVLSCVPAGIQTVTTANIFHLDARFATAVWLVNTLAFTAVVLPLVVWILG